MGRRKTYEDGGRDQSYVATTKEHETTREPGRRKVGFSPRSSQGSVVLLMPRVQIVVSRTVRSYIAVVLSIKFMVICYSSFRKLMCLPNSS